MTAAVPGPRFRDQLAEALRMAPGITVLWPSSDRIADALMPTIAAEVEARVQAAANQRAEVTSEMVRAAWAEFDQAKPEPMRRAIAAALASPAPAA